MKILALETSTKMGSIALTDDSNLVGEYQIPIKESYSEVLLPAIEHFLNICDIPIHTIDAFALAQGPGSFTSLRIGMSVIKGFSMKTKVPVIPIPSLDGLAHNLCYSNHLICPLMDARKGEVYTAFYKRQEGALTKISADMVLSPEKFMDEIDEKVVLLGDGAILYKDLIQKRLQGQAHFAPLNLTYPRASAIAHLAFEKIRTVKVVENTALLTPLYVRRPEAEVKWGKSR
jgi:tRNA threonylcarbamoyladenosine biosynthesis protein TsaB